ncbi:helix-turn-helix transcriptional regulator [Phaeacidiphilus oryzae]|uniref:helix-turn-helix transcriptional regulator n=1 Tax=Phaeacidiphilus oryzae TaxID=348818 RepID=UPI00055C04F2|nr:WYL domain-containing protein [Phaeacidiphilus oryzae]
MSRPTARVLTLLELLQSGGTRSTAELADRLGVDPRTVRRYAEHLADLGLPVESVRGRYGGYRLGRGYRLPPLMLDEDEALAVLLGLLAGPRAARGGAADTAAETAAETAAAKIRRVLPRHLAERLDGLLAALRFTDRTAAGTAGAPAAPSPDAAVLLTVADAVRHHRPLAVRYTDREGRRSDRTLHPYGIVSHSGRWYVNGADPGAGEERTLRLDRIADARALPGAFEPPPGGADRAERVLAGFAGAGYRHRVELRIQATVRQIRARLPPAIALLDEAEAPSEEIWRAVTIHAERLDWLPPLLAALDRPFVVRAPDELRALTLAFAERLADRARRAP